MADPELTDSKKAAAAANRKALGRPKNSLRIGVVGLPNVGKSGLFNALCNVQADSSNFPFCTIDPNEARCKVQDDRFDKLVEVWKPASRVPAYLQVTDIAGLVKGAASGAGLGNAFLSNISAVDGIFHVVRIFDDAEVSHVEGEVDPVRDVQIITDELILKDLEHVTKQLETLEKARQKKSKDREDKIAVYNKVKESLESGVQARHVAWNAKESLIVNELLLLTAKPVVFLLNMGERDFLRQKNKWLKKVHAWVQENSPGEPMIPFCGSVECMLQTLDADLAKQWLEENKTQSVLQKIVKAGRKALELEAFFTVGEDEVRQWSIASGRLAPEAAGVIHSDMQNGFICAEIYSYDSWVENDCSEQAVKAAGKQQQKGKTYVMQDGDICFFKFNPTGGKKKKK